MVQYFFHQKMGPQKHFPGKFKIEFKPGGCVKRPDQGKGHADLKGPVVVLLGKLPGVIEKIFHDPVQPRPDIRVKHGQPEIGKQKNRHILNIVGIPGTVEINKMNPLPDMIIKHVAHIEIPMNQNGKRYLSLFLFVPFEGKIIQGFTLKEVG